MTFLKFLRTPFFRTCPVAAFDVNIKSERCHNIFSEIFIITGKSALFREKARKNVVSKCAQIQLFRIAQAFQGILKIDRTFLKLLQVYFSTNIK